MQGKKKENRGILLDKVMRLTDSDFVWSAMLSRYGFILFFCCCARQTTLSSSNRPSRLARERLRKSLPRRHCPPENHP